MTSGSSLQLTNVISGLEKGNPYGAIGSMAWNKDGTMLAASVDFGGGNIRIWNRDGTLLTQMYRRTDFHEASSLAFVDDDRHLLTAPADRNREDVVFSGLSITSGAIELNVVGSFKDGPLRLNAADAFILSPDRRVLAVSTAPRKTQPIKLYHAPNWTEPQVLEDSATGFRDAVTSMAFSHDGQRLALGRVNGEILVYNVRTGRLNQRLSAFLAAEHTVVESLAFSMDDKSIVAGAGIAAVLPLTANREFSPGPTTPILAAVDDPIRVFDLTNGRCVLALKGLSV